jgi:allantoinase
MSATIVRGATIVTPSGRKRADIFTEGGVIRAVGSGLGIPSGTEIVDAGGLVVLPGVIDPHSHLWETGFVSDPDFADSSASAAAGGITTLIDMPLTVPEVLDAATLRDKARLGERTSHVDFALHGGVSPHNLDALEPMWREGATAFKIFTCETGCPMGGLIDDADLLAALRVIGSFGGLATFHAENDELLKANLARLRREERGDNMAFSAWRDETVELEAINRILFYAGRTGTRVNIVHVTSPEGVALIAEARARGVDATAETCPHYLHLTTEDLAERGAWVTCSPPVRDPQARDGMRRLVGNGAIATVGSDHGPVDPALKLRGSNNVLDGQPGMPGNETMVPLLLDLVGDELFSLERLAEITAEAPARLYGLYPRKGAIAVGSDADFTIVDPEQRWTISADALIGKCGWTPYEGQSVRGRVEMTIVRGRVIARQGRVVGAPGGAAFVRRNGAVPVERRRTAAQQARATVRA